MSEVTISRGEDGFDAIVVDSSSNEDSGSFIIVVSRLDPELTVDQLVLV